MGSRPPVAFKKHYVVKDPPQLHKDMSACSISEDSTNVKAKIHDLESTPSPVSPSKGDHPLKGFSYLAPSPKPNHHMDAHVKIPQGPRPGINVKKLHPDNDQRSLIMKSHNKKDDMDDKELMLWWSEVEAWKKVPSYDHYFSTDLQVRAFTEKVQRVQRALRVYNILLTERGESLQNNIIDLRSLADNTDKVSKKVKIAKITGATGAVGGVATIAAVAGVVLSPITMGASLAVAAAAIGVGVAATGAATGASAAIAGKVTNNQDRKKVETILQNYTNGMGEIEQCLMFIQMGMEHLRRYNLSTLTNVDTEAVQVARIMEVADGGQLGVVSRSAGIIEGFAAGMDLLFNKDQKLKKGKESTFAEKICMVANQLQSQLDECFKYRERLEKMNYILPTVN